ncbi:hypothetical protein ACNJX9_36130 [Bradyrhizobium sp. DASA03076]
MTPPRSESSLLLGRNVLIPQIGRNPKGLRGAHLVRFQAGEENRRPLAMG